MGVGRMTIGLYNSYDPVRFAEAHRRAIARSAPVALAFDANLATFGFPYGTGLRTPQEVAAWVSGTTSIGEAGKYLRELADAGRFPEALASLDATLGFDPGEAEVWREHGAVALKAGRARTSLRSLERATDLDPRDTAAWELRARSLEALGRTEEAARCRERARAPVSGVFVGR